MGCVSTAQCNLYAPILFLFVQLVLYVNEPYKPNQLRLF